MISVIINCDTRQESASFTSLGNGVVSRDFIVQNLLNKKKFFDGFDCEFIAYIDEHESVTDVMLQKLREHCDTVVLRKHSRHYKGADPFNGFNDVNYLHALSLARGEYIAHFDQDMGAYARDHQAVAQLIEPVLCDEWKYVCYPSAASPKCVDDPSFGGHVWASTRFFFTRKDTIDITEMEQAICEPETLYAKYGRPSRECPWMEHFLGIAAGGKVYYPPLSNDILIFPWQQYTDGTFERLNNAEFDDIYMRLIAAGAHSYHGCESQRLIFP